MYYMLCHKILGSIKLTIQCLKVSSSSCHTYTTYIGFFITTNSVEAPTVRSTIHMHFNLNYNTGYTYISLAAVHHYTRITCF